MTEPGRTTDHGVHNERAEQLAARDASLEPDWPLIAGTRVDPATIPSREELADDGQGGDASWSALALPLSDRSAVLSDDRCYRYVLRRDWGAGGRVLFVMLNPSTADETADDPTIRRCIGFAKSWACGGLTVVNLYAWRATKPDALKGVIQPVGEFPWRPNPEPDAFAVNRNDWEIEHAAADCGLRIAAWGAWPGPIGYRARDVYDLLRRTRCQGQQREKVYCLGHTKDGSPRHPLYVPGDTHPVPWGRPR